MDIAICTDNNYVMPAGVLICSICENNADERINFHVVSDDKLTNDSKHSLSEVVNQYNQNISFYCIDNHLNSLLPVGRENQLKHITIATYYRLFLINILPSEIDKVLYLDCDIIVRHSLKDLWNTDISDYAIGCVADQREASIDFYNRLRYSQNLGYFNAGVLLINLAYWREYGVQDEFIEFLRNYPERVVNHDQDVLNYVLRNKKKKLPLKYNVQTGFLTKELKISWEYEDELRDAISKPCVIHYLNREKPWMKGCDHPFKLEFFKYRQLTKWRDCPLQKCKVKLSAKVRIRNFLSILGVVSRIKLYDFRDDLKLLD